MVSLSRLLAAADDAPLEERARPSVSSRLPPDSVLPPHLPPDSVTPALHLALAAQSPRSPPHPPASPSLPLQHLLADLGPEATSPANMATLIRALSHFGRPSESAVAAALLFLASNDPQQPPSDDNHSLFNLFALFCSNPDNPSADPSVQQAITTSASSSPPLDWRSQAFVNAISSVASQFSAPIDWRLVLRAFDSASLHSSLTSKAFIEIANAYVTATGGNLLPSDALVTDWRYPPAQLCILTHALSSPRLVDWTILDAFDGATQEDLLSLYSRVPLVEKLVELNAYELLQQAIKQDCDALLLSLACAKPRSNASLQHKLTVSLLTPVLSLYPSSEKTLRQVWNVSPALVEGGIISMWKKDPAMLRKALSISVGLHILVDILSTGTSLEFSLELAILAYREDVLQLENWLNELFATRGLHAVSLCSIFMAQKVRTGDPPEATKMTLDSVQVIFRSIVSAIRSNGGSQTQELMDGIREIVDMYRHLNPRVGDLSSGPDLADRNVLVGMEVGTPPSTARAMGMNDAGSASVPNKLSAGSIPMPGTGPEEQVPADAASTAAAMLLSLSSGPNSTGMGFASEVDKEADVFFQNLYRGEMPPEVAVERLRALKSSSLERERELFNCALHTLFDEYRFFLKYPDRELKITGMLFGSVIEHSLITGSILALAIRCVLDALRTVEPAPHPIGRYAKFGLCALEMVRPRLHEWPQFCSHILDIPRLKELAPELIGEVSKALQHATASPPLSESHTISITAPESHPLSDPLLSFNDGAPPPANITDPADTANNVSSLLASPTISATSTPVKPSMSSTSLRPSPSVGVEGALGLSPLNLTNLLGMTSQEANQIVAPDETTQDKIKFIFNNLSTSTMQDKVQEMLNILNPEFQRYFSVYIVVKRASSESNFHHLYITMLDKIDPHLPTLYPMVYDTSYRRVRVLLSSDKSKTTSAERLVLKSLGSWMGSLTLARDKPILRRDLDLKELLMDAYSNGRLTTVVPFVSKILEACPRSTIFKTTSPWVRGVLGLMKEIYSVDDLKLNMKFELQLLSKSLSIDVNVIVASDLLRGRPAPDKTQNPDFNTKKPLGSSPHRAAVSPVASPSSDIQRSYLSASGARAAVPVLTLTAAQSDPSTHPVSLAQGQPAGSSRLDGTQPLVSNSLNIGGDGTTELSNLLASASISANVAPNGLERNASQVSASLAGQPASAGTSNRNASAASSTSYNQTDLLFPNLTQYIQVSQSLVLFQTSPHLKRLIPLAIDRAIREIIQPVVERSCAIAFLTTKELTLKDFANEPDMAKIRRAAIQMVQQLAGSLALVTSKEPLRVSMGNQLRLLFTPSVNAPSVSTDQNIIEQAAHVVCNSNLDIGCAIIERHAKEKAGRDMSEKIGTAFANRRPQQSAYTYGIVPGPEVHHIYEEFSRLHRVNIPSSQYDATPAMSPTTHAVHSSHITSVGPSVSLQPQMHHSRPVQSYNELGTNGPIGEGKIDIRVPTPQVSPQHIVGNSGNIVEPERVDSSSHFMGTRRASPVLQSSDEAQPLPVATRVYGTALPKMASPSSVAAALLAAAGSSNTAGGNNSHNLQQVSTGNGSVPGEEALSTPQVLERFNAIYPQLTSLIEEATSAGKDEVTVADLSADHRLHSLWPQIPAAVKRSVTADEAGMAVAQKMFKRLYEGESNLYRELHVLILDGLRESCRRLSKELSSWLAFSEDRKKLHRECIIALLKPGALLNITAYDEVLAKAIDSGRNAGALDFACFLVQHAVIEELLATAAELYLTLEMIWKVGRRPNPPTVASCPEGLTVLVEKARSIIPKPTMSAPAASGSVGTNISESGHVGVKTAKDVEPAEPSGVREYIAGLLLEWHRLVSSDSPTRSVGVYLVSGFLHQMHSGVLANEETRERFFRITVELVSAVTRAALQSREGVPPVAMELVQTPYTVVEGTVRLVASLCRFDGVGEGSSENAAVKDVSLLYHFLTALVKDILKSGTSADLRPHFRLFSGLMVELGVDAKVKETRAVDLSSVDASFFNNAFADRLAIVRSKGDALQFLDDVKSGYAALVRMSAGAGDEKTVNFDNVQVVMAVVGALTACSPTAAPGFVFSWLQLISSKELLPTLLSLSTPYGWPLFRHLLVRMLEFLGKFLVVPGKQLSKGVRTLYSGLLRVLLVLLHDFPEFLCGYHMALCEAMPGNCVQLRNLVLASFPKDMRLPDPFNPDLNVEELAEMKDKPLILSDYMRHIDERGLRGFLDNALHHGVDAVEDTNVLVKVVDKATGSSRYDAKLIGAIVMYAGELGVERGGGTHGRWMDLMRRIMGDVDAEGRHHVLMAIANQLRFPNSHTMFYSKMMLGLFLEAQDEALKEHTTRVLVERLIANRPHPWGLLITFVQLIKKSEYNFWAHGFVRCAPEIEQLFENVAKFCVGPVLPKPSSSVVSAPV